jgi:hypothetical protein
MIAVGFALILVRPLAARAARDEPVRRVLLLDFEGTQAAGVRQWVDQRIRPLPGIEVVPRSDVSEEANATASSEKIAAVAKEADLCAVVRGSTVGRGGKWTLTLVVLDGATGDTLDTLEFESTWVMGIKKELDASLAKRFEPVVARCHAPTAEVEPEEAEEPVEAGEAPEASEPSTSEAKHRETPVRRAPGDRPAAIQLELGVPLFTRRFRYEQDVTQTLRSYRLDGLAPGVVAGLVWYPGAHFTSHAAAHVGLTGRYFQGFPPAAEREGRSLDTTTRSYRFGLRLRIPARPLELAVVGEYGAHDYQVARDPVTGVPVVPDVGYRFVRPGLGLGIQVDAFTAEVTGGVRVVLDTGELESAVFFPNLSGYGLDGSLAAGGVAGPVAVLAQGAFERYRFALNPSTVAPSPYGVAGLAIDSGYSVSLLVRLTLR